MQHLSDSFGIGSLERLFLFFAAYALVGWLIEVPYRSFSQRRFVNAGFLKGPFLPIYGFGAIFVLSLDPLTQGRHPLVQLLAYGVVLTATEYAVGYVSERVFGLRLWDYSRDRFNLHGRVCLSFSALWAGLAFTFRRYVHPSIAGALSVLDGSVRHAVVVALASYIALDFIVSTALLRDLVARLSSFHLRRIRIGAAELGRFRETFRRLLTAFPNLKGYLEASFQHGIRDRIDEKVSALHMRFFLFVESRQPRDEEFRALVRDIMRNKEFQRLREFPHHDSSILRHALRVALLSYKIGKYLKMDYRAIARGGLLHDFFLYDWRHHDLPDLAKEKFHGLEHPKIALRNAERNFELTGLERDIIVKHMWPLTLRPPSFRESMVVSCVDKQVATREFWVGFRNRRQAARALRR
jgi:uncharacterized membrane protein